MSVKFLGVQGGFFQKAPLRVPLARSLIAKLSDATLVGGDGVSGGGDGTADDDVVGADLACGGGGHDSLLVTDIAVGKADAGRDGQEFLAALFVDKSRLKRRANDTVKACLGGARRIVHDDVGNGLLDEQVVLHALSWSVEVS